MATPRPDSIASMTLYEPTAFHLLRQMGQAGAKAFAEISAVARRLGQCVIDGDYRAGVADFVDYWSYPGAWNAMRPELQKALMRWAPKGPLDFRALFEDPTPGKAYRVLNFPVLILRGEHAPLPTRVISERLLELLPRSQLKIIPGAGHMGPLTHASKVSEVIVQHIAAASSMRSQTDQSLMSSLTRLAMSAFGPKRTSLAAPHMSAFGSKADIPEPSTCRSISRLAQGVRVGPRGLSPPPIESLARPRDVVGRVEGREP